MLAANKILIWGWGDQAKKKESCIHPVGEPALPIALTTTLQVGVKADVRILIVLTLLFVLF